MNQLPPHLSDHANGQITGNGFQTPLHRLPKPTPKRVGFILLGVAACLLVVWVLRPTPIPVDGAVVSRGPLQVTVDAEGKTRVHDRYIIPASVDGQLDRINFNEGDLVQAGTLIARIDPLPLTASVQEALGRLAAWRAERAGVATRRPKNETLEQANLRIRKAEADQRQAEAKVAQAEAALVQARRDRERAQQLATTGAISRQVRETAELNETTRRKEWEATQLAAKASASEVAVARAGLAVLKKEQTDPDYLLKVYDARIASTEAELARLQDEARRTEIRSPVQGRVLRVMQKSARFVTEGTPLLELGDVSNLEVVVDVLSSDATRIKPGQPMIIDQGTEASPLRATVRLVEPSAFTKVSALGVEEQRVNVIGDFLKPPQGLGDGYRVEVQVVVWAGKDVLKLPLSALFRCGQSWCVFTVKADRARRQSVQVGHRSQAETEILQGLTAGDRVILHPTEQISDGKPVRVR